MRYAISFIPPSLPLFFSLFFHFTISVEDVLAGLFLLGNSYFESQISQFLSISVQLAEVEPELPASQMRRHIHCQVLITDTKIVKVHNIVVTKPVEQYAVHYFTFHFPIALHAGT